jgi:hypothetical protein
VPASRTAKSTWLKTVARNEEIALYLVGHLGVPVDGLEAPFRCVFEPEQLAKLTRGRNGEIVYHAPHLASIRREFQTIPELAAALRSGTPKRLTPVQHSICGVRLLSEAGLLALPTVDVPPLDANSPIEVKRARDGFELLIRCRSFLDPGEPVAYTRSFVQDWCGLPISVTRDVIKELVRQGVIVKVGETASGREHPTYLYRPGQGEATLTEIRRT